MLIGLCKDAWQELETEQSLSVIVITWEVSEGSSWWGIQGVRSVIAGDDLAASSVLNLLRKVFSLLALFRDPSA